MFVLIFSNILLFKTSLLFITPKMLRIFFVAATDSQFEKRISELEKEKANLSRKLRGTKHNLSFILFVLKHGKGRRELS